MSQGLTLKRVPIWLDCDPGHDDAFAILLCAQHPNIDFLGVSTVHGNASVEKTTKNASSVLRAFNRTDVPLYPGANKPFCRRALHAADIHGESGIDGTDLLPKPYKAAGHQPGALPAVEATYKALMECPPETAWIVATGTLTNVAVLLSVYPDIADHIAGISIMGGAIGDSHSTVNVSQASGGNLEARIGNITPFAEFNIYCDPEAANAIFSHPKLGGKVILIPLDITHRVLATPSVLKTILGSSQGGSPAPLRKMMYDLLVFFSETYARVFGITDGPPLHDPLAVAAVLHWEGVYRDVNFQYGGIIDELPTCAVTVVTEGRHGDGSRLGATMVSPANEDSRVMIPTGLDIPAFWRCVYACLAQAEAVSEMLNMT